MVILRVTLHGALVGRAGRAIGDCRSTPADIQDIVMIAPSRQYLSFVADDNAGKGIGQTMEGIG